MRRVDEGVAGPRRAERRDVLIAREMRLFYQQDVSLMHGHRLVEAARREDGKTEGWEDGDEGTLTRLVPVAAGMSVSLD